MRENSWRGNVRELQDTLERAVILGKGGVIKPVHLIFEKDHSAKSNCEENNFVFGPLDKETKKVIKKALQLTSSKIYDKDGAAALLKMKSTILQSKIKKPKIIP